MKTTFYFHGFSGRFMKELEVIVVGRCRTLLSLCTRWKKK